MTARFPARLRRCGFLVLAWLLLGQVPTLFAAHYEATAPGAGAFGQSKAQQQEQNVPDGTEGVLPRFPVPRSPIDFFRELLAMDPVERRKHLSDRPQEKQKLLLEKVHEYLELTPNQRELRLRSTELRWYLLPLMQTPATNRAHQLEMIPADLRDSVENRLAAWDQVPLELQRELLEHEAAIRHDTESQPGAGTQSVTAASGGSRSRFDTTLARWRLMPEPHRQEVMRRFEKFFLLDAREQADALKSVSQPERRQIELTLDKFASLTPAQRSECLRALQKYAELAPEERRQFLKDAERWKAMDPDKRQAWRDLVQKMGSEPPLPPGARPVVLPPIPPRITNGH